MKSYRITYPVTLGLLALLLLVSFPGAHDRVTWWLEVFPIFLAAPVVWYYGRTGRLSPFLQTVIVFHALILCIGGHSTYALAPPGEWIRALGIGSRNNYDKLGHFMQGVTPVIAIREILSRQNRWEPHAGFMATLAVLAAGGISAVYEVVEMVAALLLGGGADAFLGTQGFVWDTQTDMATALIGALFAVLLFSKTHRNSLVH